MTDRDDLVGRGPRIVVNLAPPSAEKSSLREMELTALLNTASEVTWVDRRCINRLRLKPTDSDSIPWFNGERFEVDLFTVDIEILADTGKDRHELVEVACTDLSFMQCEVVVGRNLLKHYELRYSGPTGMVKLMRAA